MSAECDPGAGGNASPITDHRSSAFVVAFFAGVVLAKGASHTNVKSGRDPGYQMLLGHIILSVMYNPADGRRGVEGSDCNDSVDIAILGVRSHVPGAAVLDSRYAL